MTTTAGGNATIPAPAAAAAAVAAAAPSASQASPRKRRRRAPTTGAADDCFTCRDRGVGCDRRRPYCTQCLDMKVTCSGYKTQLTWGVGVASRGKLRGLSLPVAKVKTSPTTPTEKSATKKASAPSSSASTSTPTSQTGSGGKARPPPTPSSATATATSQPQFIQQPTPAPSVSNIPLNYAFVGAGHDTSVQSAPPYQTNFEWPTQQPKYVSDVRHQPLPGEMPAGRHNGQYERPLKRQALHLDTSDTQQYVRQAPNHPMTAQPALGHGDFTGRAYNSPVSPYQPQMFEPSHVRHNSFTAQGNRPVHLNGQRPVQTHHHHHQSLGSPNHWSTGYPSPSAVSDHGSYVSVSTPEAAFSSTGLSDPRIGMAADHLLAMQQPQHHFLAHNSFTSYGHVDAIPETVEDDIEEIGHGNSSDTFSFAGDLIRMNQTFATQEKIGNTPELRYLINYYLEVLTPVIIAFDGPGNPWREHVLSLARHNEGLQHAIAALSASNLRMRREHKNDQPRLPLADDSVHDVSVRRSSEAHQRLNDEHEPPALSRPGAPSAREIFHKNESVKALNQQLADVNGRSDDSILAILLVICLYHMCETGVAKFKTQFAGVKKILAMRSRQKVPSKEVNWIITFFKWFDAMAATVNDRESQFTWEPMPLLDNNEEWGLENLAGCDSQLFSIVNKLGRLNVLSQGRSPDLSPEGSGMTPPPFFNPVAGPHGSHLHPDLVFDGSGWAHMPSTPTTSSSVENSSSVGDGHDQRTAQFWAEWSQVRQELINWQFDPSYLPAPMRVAAQQLRSGSVSSAVSVASLSPSTLSTGMGQHLPPHQQFADTSIADISNISQSFRHAALLYTERLAWPSLPPEHPQLQGIVHTALRYIRLVKSDVCLLWPLFIVGAECVRDEDRSVVRTRVWDIQKDSGFFNNIKCLELLEVIWSKADRAKRMNSNKNNAWNVDDVAARGDVFKWREEMRNAEGEYIVI